MPHSTSAAPPIIDVTQWAPAKLQALADGKAVLLSLTIATVLVVLAYYRHGSSTSTPSLDEDEMGAGVEQADLPVLIVGAGPTGLTLATVLARYGIPVRIIEQKSHLSRHTKATNLMQRNQEFMYALGLLDRLNGTGGQMSRLMVHAYGNCFGPRTMHLNETPFQNVLLCGQHNFEQVMAEELGRLNVPVEFGAELTEAIQRKGSVQVKITKEGKPKESTFSYMIGADGGRGISRTFSKLDFQTTKTGVAIRQVDCKLQWKRLSTMDQMWLFYFDHGFAAVIPLPGNVHRLLCIEPKTAFPERGPTLDEMQAKLRVVVDDPTLALEEPDWFSYTDLSMGIAPALQDGRIILAGDASNPILPNGGQGMNTGITDAFNLGWKLAAVLKYRGPKSLLRTYDIERHIVRTKLQKSQYNSLRYTTLVTPKIMQAAFRWFAEPLLNLGGEYLLAQVFSELTISTRESPLSIDADRKRPRRGLRAGDRALDAPVVHDLTSIQIYSLIYRGSWTLLLFSGRCTHSQIRKMFEIQSHIGKSRPGLNIYLVLTEVLTGSDHKTVLYDLDEPAHRAYGVGCPAIFVIRPDGHIGVRASPSNLEVVEKYLSRWIPVDGQAFLAI